MRKDFILIFLTLVGLAYLFISMTKNTRFESNLISCVNGQVSFQITYKKLKRDMFVNFEKPDEEITTFKITNLDGENFHFEHQLSKFKINLDEQTAIETRSGEKLIYKCALESFKM
jgi:hypothetical protein